MKKALSIILLCVSVYCKAQNLVLNPSFEDTIPCSIFQNNNYPQMPCTGWYWASGGSCDYFSEQYLCISSPAPSNGLGFHYAKTGIAYCGFQIYMNPIFQPNGYREYLGGQLIDTLKQGHTYCVSFYVVKSDSGKYYTSNIGMYLSLDNSVDYSTALNLPYTPQIVNTNGIIYDTLNWTQISGTYIAGGGEKYFIIGNFNDDANTTLDSNNQANLFYAVSYYFIDDVSVVDCTVGINEIESYKNKISLLPNPAKDESVYSIFLNRNETGSMIVYSKLGVKLLNKQLVEGNNTVSIPLTELGAGVYFIQTYVNGKNTDIRKLVVVQ